jgi:hypothetical protein
MKSVRIHRPPGICCIKELAHFYDRFEIEMKWEDLCFTIKNQSTEHYLVLIYQLKISQRSIALY